MRRRAGWGRAIALLALAMTARAQVPSTVTRVADICSEPEPDLAFAIPFHDLGGIVVFFPPSSGGLPQLWTTDGTPAGTRRLWVPELDMATRPAAVIDGVLVFNGWDWSYGLEPWRTDGTIAGTSRVRDLAPGPGNGQPAGFTTMGGALYFHSQEDPSLRAHLWRTDGTATGTTIAADVDPTWDMVALDSVLVFEGGSSLDTAGDLWASDGTAGGTLMLHDFPPSGPPSGLARCGNAVIFAAGEDAPGREPWMTDGTIAGTRMVVDIAPGSRPSDPGPFACVGAVAFFAADDGISGRELWVTDGTGAGTRLVADLRPGGAGSNPTALCGSGGRVYFAADDGVSGMEIWVSDGTTAGTTQLADLASGPSGSMPQGLTPTPWGVVIAADDGIAGAEPWITDGTPAGTRLLADIEAGAPGSTPSGFTVAGGKLFFTACTDAVGCEPWVSDGTTAGTMLLADVKPPVTGSWPHALVAAGDRVHFMASDGSAHGTEPWLSDGTAAGTRLHADLTPGSGSSPLRFVAPVTDRVLAVGLGSRWLVDELWSFSAEGGDPQLLGDIHAGWGYTPLSVVDGTAAFTGVDALAGEEPFVTDGTQARTSLLADVNPGPAGSRGQGHALAGAGSTFLGFTGSSDLAWIGCDLTPAGTGVIPGSPRMEFQVDPNLPGGYSPRGWSASGWSVAAGWEAATGTEPWITDGTAAGTRALGDLSPGTASTWLVDAAPFRGGILLCLGTDAGREPWFSDGTPAGTVALGDLYPGPGESWPIELTDAGAFALFAANDGVTGYELWRTDGTAAGTSRVADIFPGAPGSAPRDLLVAAPGLVLFSANDAIQGRELWLSDGTQAGTRRWAETWPGPESGDPAELVHVGADILFAADDGAGRELYRLSMADESGSCANGSDDDGDGAADCADADCATDPSCAGFDHDLDGVLNADDCAPTDPQAHHVPGEVDSLDGARAGTDMVLSWADPVPAAGTGTRADVSSARITSLASGGWSCVADGVPPPWLDARAGSWAYLVRATNACGPAPDAGWGARSDGVRRDVSCP